MYVVVGYGMVYGDGSVGMMYVGMGMVYGGGIGMLMPTYILYHHLTHTNSTPTRRGLAQLAP
ncbi:hypothetical protein EON63_11185 [archaeon]|nr:MAG: hypothetical protein EON63_11185 [archaeon]